MKTSNQPESRRHIAWPRPLAALCLAFAPLPACAVERPVSDERAEKIEMAKAALTDKGFKGVIAIAYDGEAPVYAGFGEVTASGVPDKRTQVELGSIVKTFTGAAAMKLVDAGSLSMADRLADFFPDAPADKAAITVHQLLTHSAGFTHAVGEDDEYLSKDDFLKRAMNEPLIFEPGSAYEYSNVGVSLAAAIIEEVSGKSYENFVHEDLLGNLDARDIGYEAAFDASRSMLTQNGQTIDRASWGGRSHWALIGNGGMVASAESMIAFIRAYESSGLTTNAAKELSHAPMVREGERAPTYAGYGLVVDDHPQFGRSYWHNGGSENFTANWTHYADHGLIVFAASQGHDVNADIAVEAIAATLLLEPAN